MTNSAHKFTRVLKCDTRNKEAGAAADPGSHHIRDGMVGQAPGPGIDY